MTIACQKFEDIIVSYMNAKLSPFYTDANNIMVLWKVHIDLSTKYSCIIWCAKQEYVLPKLVLVFKKIMNFKFYH